MANDPERGRVGPKGNRERGSGDDPLLERITGEFERRTGQEEARDALETLARDLRRERHDAAQRLQRRRAAQEAERNPRRGVRRGSS
jgi:hypothetical protein